MSSSEETASIKKKDRGFVLDFHLVIVAGKKKGATFVVPARAASRIYVGKSEACDVRLEDELVSRRHAALEVVRNRLRVTDLESTNGTRLNACEVLDALAKAGDTLTFGATTLRVEQRVLDQAPGSDAMVDHFGRVYGASSEMRRLYPLCERVARSDVPVLVEGETGTGKEVLAESLHEASPRAGKPFVIFDCTTVPPNLAEAILFGHEKGAFTGAVATVRGVFEQAHGGTLFIDEIGDLEFPLQAKLLRAIERHDVRRVGGSAWINTDVRIITATRRDLEKEIQAGRFRDDLFYRLAVTRIELPPLRRRAGDVERLAHQFWAQLGGAAEEFPSDYFHKWEGYAWPGNVRELFNRVARWRAVGDLCDAVPAEEDGETAPEPKGAHDIIDEVLDLNLPFAQAKEQLTREFERRFLDQSLIEHGGNISRAAAATGIARRYFYVLRSRHSK